MFSVLFFGTLQSGPLFHGLRSSREMRIQNASCQNGWSQSYKVIKLLLSAGKRVVAKL